MYKWGVQIPDLVLVWVLALVILGMVVVALILLGLYKLNMARRARTKKKDEEVLPISEASNQFLVPIATIGLQGR